MIHESKLIRTGEKVAHYIENYATLVGAERKEEVFDLFNTMHKIFPQWVILSCPMMHPEIHYITKNVQHVFGYNDKFLLEKSKLEKFFYLVHEDDQEDLYQCISELHDFLETISPEEHHLHRAILFYRMKTADGKYVYVHDEKATLHLKGGNLYYVMLRNISEERTFSGVKLEIYKQEESLNRIREFKPGTEKRPFSKRETELISLLKQGLSTKEIGYRLNISHHTVRNIKSKLFEKYNVSNSIELLNLTQ